jgi:hypothetical protein
MRHDLFALDELARRSPPLGTRIPRSRLEQDDVELVDIASNGTYQSTVCGTGTLDSNPGSLGGTVTAATSAIPGSGGVPPVATLGGLASFWGLEGPTGGQVDLSYHVDFAGNHGVLKFTGSPRP